MASAPVTSAPILVVLPAGFMPPLLLAVPAGARLPSGVQAVVAFPAAAVVAARGSGRRGATMDSMVAFPASAVVAAPVSGRRSATMRSVAAHAASEAGDTADDDCVQAQLDLELGKKSVLEFWAAFERSSADDYIQREAYELTCFSEDIVANVEKTAARGTEFATRVLVALVPEGFSDLNVSRESDLNNVKMAGICFRRVHSEAKNGYVRATSVLEAARALELLHACTIARAMLPSGDALPDVPCPMDDPSSYYKDDLAEGLAKLLLDAAEATFQKSRRI